MDQSQSHRVRHRRHRWGYCALAALTIEAFTLWAIFGPPGDDLVRQAGVVLQLLGVIIVAIGIRDTRHLLLGKPKESVLQRIRQLVLRMLGRQPVNVAVGSASIMVASSKLEAFLTHGFDKTLPLSLQVEALQSVLNRIEVDFGKGLASLADKVAGDVQQLVSSEKQAREVQAREMDRLFRSAHTGGLDLSMFGTVCLLLGALFGGAPHEVISTIRWIVG